MADPLILGVVRCRQVSHWHASAARRLAERLRFVACCDIRRETADVWAAEHGADHVYTDYEAMIAEEQLDGMILATCPALHREHVEGALGAGARNILCEKALTLRGQQALEIRDPAAEAGAVLMEGYMYPSIRRRMPSKT